MAKSTYADVMFRQMDENYGWTKLYNFISVKSRVLDIGCSSGNFGKVLIERKQCSVVGVDIHEDDLKLASKNLTQVAKRNVETDDLGGLGKFDYVLMADVIEHLMDPVAALAKVKKVLKPGGKLVFSVPNMANVANRIELLGGRFEYTEFGLLDETHVHYYDRVEFERVMARAGFKVLKYNNTIRDLPSAVLKSQLEKLGLTPSPKFLKMAQSIDSITFQFIGVAKPQSEQVKHAELASKTPHDFFSQQFDELHQAHKAQIDHVKLLKNELNGQRQSYRRLEQAKNELAHRLGAIENSKGWRLLSRFYKAKKALSEALRRK